MDSVGNRSPVESTLTVLFPLRVLKTIKHSASSDDRKASVIVELPDDPAVRGLTCDPPTWGACDLHEGHTLTV